MDKTILQGTILKGVGGLYHVLCGNDIYACKPRGKLRMQAEVPLSGDKVQFEPGGENHDGVILSILPRRNFLMRPAVANIDLLFITASEAPPVTDPYLIDKVTVIALCKGIKPVIVLTKTDLNQSSVLHAVYEKAGFEVLNVSAETGEGTARLKSMMANKISAFTGNSGIGKSSLLNSIDSKLGLRVGAISDKINRGKQTTRHVELMLLDNGGMIADTPGFSSFEIGKMERIKKDELENYFPEISAMWGQCRFQGCAHIKEPGCALRKALKEGEIAQSRYDSYVKLYEELALVKDWQ